MASRQIEMCVLSMGILGACAGTAHAQEAGPAAEGAVATAPEAAPEVAAAGGDGGDGSVNFRMPAPEWRVKIEPRMWWVSPNGDVKLPAASGTGPGSFTDSGQSVEVSRLNLDSPRLSAAGGVEVAAGMWRFAFSGGGFSLTRDQTTADAAFRIGSVEVSPGEAMSTRMDYSTFELTLGYDVWSRDFQKASKDQEKALDANLRVLLLGGGRIHDLDVDVESLVDGTSAGTDQTYFEVIGGARLEAELLERFSISFQATGGIWYEADRSIYSFDMQVAFGWEPVDHLQIEIGWRQMLFSMSDGDDSPAVDQFEYTGGMAGLFLGVVVTF